MNLLRSVIEHFVMPSGLPRPAAHGDFVTPDEGPDRACAEPAPRTPSGVALLSAVADAQPLGAALGLAVAHHLRAAVAVVCVWTTGQAGRPQWRAPALPAARRLAASLDSRGHDVRAAGRLAVVRLPGEPDEAAAQARRVLAAAGDAPTVLALGGARVAAFDELLAEQDLVVVATPNGTDPALARLALAGLASGATTARVCEVPSGRAARSVAAAGLALLPSTRRALAGHVHALS